MDKGNRGLQYNIDFSKDLSYLLKYRAASGNTGRHVSSKY